jgi:AAA+ superfamily predicted ATPase
MTETQWPDWVMKLKNTYLTGGASVFILHGNVADLMGCAAADAVSASYSVVPLADFLSERLFGDYDLVLHYDVGRGLRPYPGSDARRLTRMNSLVGRLLGEGDLPRDATQALRLLDRLVSLLLVGEENRARKIAILFDYADLICPPGDREPEHLATLLNWARSAVVRRVNLIFILMTESLGQLHPTLVQSSSTEEIHIPMPGIEARREFVKRQFPAQAADADRLAKLSAGLTLTNLDNMMRLISMDQPRQPGSTPAGAKSGSDAPPAAESIAKTTPAPDRPANSSPSMPSTQSTPSTPSTPSTSFSSAAALSSPDSNKRISDIKKALIEAQCPGLIEFVEPRFNLDMVAGLTEARERLTEDAQLAREGKFDAVPMGYLICGPVGVGKTFLALCYAGTVGIPCVMIRNFRSKYVGETESNLERILTVLRELGPVAVIIDEADAAVGNRGATGDSGTSARVFAQLASQMGNTEYRGKIIWFLLTCRPDLLPIDLKRQGRCEEHIPLFYPQSKEELKEMFLAMAKKAKIELSADALPDLSKLPPLSGADIEGVLTRAHRESLLRNHPVDAALLGEVLKNFRSVRGPEHELQLLAAIQDCSDLRYLPADIRKQMEKPGGAEVFTRRLRELQRIGLGAAD